MTFIRTKENFTCEQCGKYVEGNGYTNHCPNCLWSRHVDIDPGDRKESCGGLMEPISLSIRGNEQIITHKCIRCGFTRKNKTNPADDARALIILSAKMI